MTPALAGPHRRRAALAAVLVMLGGAGSSARGERQPARPPPLPSATVVVDVRHVANRFRPDRALGAGLDGHARGDTARIYTPANVEAMRSAGLGALSYRLRTELGNEAWHWNPRGRWSDRAHRRGYWTSSDRPGPRYSVTYGYRLPRRGNTTDQADDTGYSRLDDGRRATFWKSNPYLDPKLTRGRHPQWVIIDLGHTRPVDALRLEWGMPYAARFRIERWVGRNAIFINGDVRGRWAPLGGLHSGRGGLQTVHLSRRPAPTRFVRVVLLRSSHTSLGHPSDVRDRLGYALREIGVGRFSGRRFVDFVHHAPSHRQSTAYVSSTDPWHRASDLDPGTEQPSFDRVYGSGLTRRRPVLVPVPVLYGTPADAAAELTFLRRRGYRVRGVELGEEPDGQLATPEDYGALYARFARALRHAAPGAPLGGPGFATSIPDWESWPDGHGTRSFMRRFLGELRRRRALRLYDFFSFEWYPFDDVCASPWKHLVRADRLLTAQLERQAQAGLPPRIPRLMTEYGYSAYAGEPEVDLAGALFDAQTVGRFLELGGRAAFLYGYEPDSLMREAPGCRSWGNLVLFQSDDARRIRHRVAAYYAMRLLTTRWAQPGDGEHLVYRAPAGPGAVAASAIDAFAVRRPDGRLAVMVVNRDPAQAWRVRLVLRTPAGTTPLLGPADAYRLSRSEYVWHPAGPRGRPAPDGPPAHTVTGLPVVDVPAASLSVIVRRGRGAG